MPLYNQLRGKMVSVDWQSVLKRYGDRIEQRGVTECGLNLSFPKYSEFWGKHVYPKRDRDNPGKLQRDVTPEFEDIFNNHYGVFYQLTFAITQIQSLPNPLLDVFTPLYHLGTTVDL